MFLFEEEAQDAMPAKIIVPHIDALGRISGGIFLAV